MSDHIIFCRSTEFSSEVEVGSNAPSNSPRLAQVKAISASGSEYSSDQESWLDHQLSFATHKSNLIFSDFLYGGSEPLEEDCKTSGLTLAEQRGIQLAKCKHRKERHLLQKKEWRASSKERTQTRRKVSFDIPSDFEFEEEDFDKKRRRRDNVRAKARAECAELKKFFARRNEMRYLAKKARQARRVLDVHTQSKCEDCKKERMFCFCDLAIRPEANTYHFDHSGVHEMHAAILANAEEVEAQIEEKEAVDNSPYGKVTALMNKWKDQIMAMLDSFEAKYGNQLLDTIHDCICFIYTISKATDSISIYGITALFIRRFNLPSTVTTLVSGLLALIHKLLIKREVESLECQSFSEEIEKLSANIGSVYDAPFIAAMRNLIVLAASNVFDIHLFSKPTAFKIFKVLGDPPKCGLIEGIQIALQCFAKVVKTFELWNAGASISEAIFADDPCASAVNDIAFCLRNESNTYTGIPVNGVVCRREFMCKLNGAMQILGVIKEKKSTRAFKDSPASKAYYDGLSLSIRMRKLEAGAFRETPLCILIAGPPSIGKSKIVNLIASAHCAVRGVKFEAGMQFTRCGASEYWDQYDPLSQKVIFYSEMGAYKSDFVAKSGDDLLKEFLSLVDSLPFPVNMSKVEDKGLNFANPWLVLLDANNKGLNIDSIFYAPGAIKRRIIVVTPRVKAEFAGPDGITLDSSKSLQSNARFMDKWHFDVTQDLPIGNEGKESRTKTHLQGASVDGLVNWVSRYSYEWIESQEKLSAMTNTGDVFFGYGSYQLIAKRLLAQGIEPQDAPDEYKDPTTIKIIRSQMAALKTISPMEHELIKQPLRTEKLWASTKSAVKGLFFKSKNKINGFDKWYSRNIEKKIATLVKGSNFMETSGVAALFDGPDCPYSVWKAANKRGKIEEFLKSMSKKFDNFTSTALMECAIACTKLRDCYEGTRSTFYDSDSSSGSIKEVVTMFDFEEELDYDSDLYSDNEEIHFDVQPQSFTESKLYYILVAWWTLLCAKCRLYKNHYDVIYPYFEINLTYCIRSVFDGYVYPVLVWCRLEKYIVISYNRFIWWLLTVVFMRLGMTKWLVMMYVFVLPLLSYSQILFTMAKEDIKKKVVAKRNEVITYFGEQYLNPDHVRIANSVCKVASILTLTVATVTVVSSSLNKKKEKVSVDTDCQTRSEFVVPSVVNDPINNIEDKMEIKMGTKKIPNKLQESWNVRTILNGSTHTGDVISLYEVVKSNIRIVKVDTGESTNSQHIFGVRGNYAVINNHATGTGKSFKLMVSPTGDIKNDTFFKVKIIDRNDCYDVGDDLLLIPTNEMFRDIVKHISIFEDLPISSCGAIIEGTKVHAERFSGSYSVPSPFGTITFDDAFKYKWEDQMYGKCGLPLIIEHGNGAWIAGIHSLGKIGQPFGYSLLIDRKLVELGLSRLQKPTDLIMSSQNYVLPQLEELSKFSPFRHEKLQGIVVYGKVPGPVCPRKKSRLMQSPLWQHGRVDEIFFDHFSVISSQRYGPPLMSFKRVNEEYIDPINIALKKISSKKSALNKAILDKCVQRFFEHTTEHLAKGGVEKGSITPHTVENAINGVLEDPNFRRIDPSKSAGFGTPGKKDKYIPLVNNEGRDVYREPIESLKKEILEVLDQYSKRQCVGIIFTAQLKDEARPVEKIASGKTRMFAMTPFASLVIARMLLGPIFSMMMTHQEAFCTAIGTDMHRDAHHLYKKMEHFLKLGMLKEAKEAEMAFMKLIMEGDYSNYDQSMPFDLRVAVCTYIKRLAIWCGYNEFSIVLLESLLTDLLFPLLCVLLELMMAAGYGPSGMYGTAEFNTLCGVLLVLYSWYYHPYLSTLDFFFYCLLVAYGDDMINAVKETVSHIFDAVYYSKFCMEHFGMPFTSTSKTDEIIPLVSLNTMSFLKRTFRFSKIFNRYVAPLDISSLIKTLTWTMPSNTVTMYEQTIQSVNSVLLEIMFHQDDLRILRKFRKELFELVVSSFDYCDVNIVDKELFTIDRCYAILCENSESYDDEKRPVTSGRLDVVPQSIRERTCEPSSQNIGQTHTESTFGRVLISEQRPSVSQIRLELDMFVNELNDLDEVENPVPGSSVEELCSNSLYSSDYFFHTKANEYISYVSRRDDLSSSIKLLTRLFHKKRNVMNLEAQSEFTMNTGSQDVEKTQNITDHMGDSKDQRNYGNTRLKPMMNPDMLDPNDFFSRPIDIYSGTITQNSDFTNIMSPWGLYLSDPSVRAKLRNYGFLRADLHIRIHISGTPFNMGRMQVSAIPWPDFNPFFKAYVSTIAATRDMFIYYLSSTKDVRYMDVADNVPLEIVLPYISPKPVARLFNEQNTVMSAATNFLDLTYMYKMCFMTLNQVESVSTDATEVAYQIFAWLENVQLSVPTSTKLDVTTQSLVLDLDVQSEFETGPIESMVTSAMGVTQALETVPVLDVYAKASTKALSVAKGVASAYGLSRPTLMSDPIRMKNEPYQNASSTVGGEVGHKMTLDPKKELTISADDVNVQDDELTLAAFNSTYALLYQFDWTSTNPVLTSLFDVNVTPTMHFPYTIVAQERCQLNPMAYTARFFKFWRGDITYKIDIVASKFHRGRIAISFDPNVFQRTIILAGIKINQPRTVIVDLQQTRTFEITVGWAHHREWATVPTVAEGKDTGNENNQKGSNGFIYIYPITRLQSPVDKSVHINVFVKSDNMKYNLFNGADAVQEMEWKTDPPPEELKLDVQCDVEWHETLTPPIQEPKDLCLRYFGEVPVSYRQMMRRYITPYAQDTLTVTDDYLTLSLPIQPLMAGSPTSALSGNTAFCMIRWLKYCFLGMRGGWKYRFYCSTKNKMTCQDVRVTLFDPSITDETYATGSSGDALQAMIGSTVFAIDTNAGVEVELPFYTNNSFVFSMEPNYAPAGSIMENLMNRSVQVKFRVGLNNEEVVATIQASCAPSDDYTLLRYVAIPPFIL